MDSPTAGYPTSGKSNCRSSIEGETLEAYYIADFICYEAVVVEAKAVSELSSAHQAQVINYLKATGHTVGLLLNFGAPRLQHPRLILSPNGSAVLSADDADS